MTPIAPIIVTGAAGFIGRNTVAELNHRGFSNLILIDDANTPAKAYNLAGLHFEALLSPRDFLLAINTGQFTNVSSLVHLGACTTTTETNAEFLLENNYRYTQQLCTWALKHHLRFVYASTAATYGDGHLGYDDDDAVTRFLQPLNMYGYSKHMFDLWALQTGLLQQIVGLKYFNVFGPYEGHKGDMRSVVAKSYEQIRDHGRVGLFKSYRPEFKDGEQMRDFVYVKDAVDVTLHFALQPFGAPGGLFNCGGGEARTWIDLVTAVFNALDKQPQIDFIEMPESLREKYQYFTQANAAKLRAAGYTKPFARLEDAVQDYVQKYMVAGKCPG